MLYTEENVRHNLRTREGRRVFFLGKKDQLTAGARDFLTRERIPILPEEQARIQHYRLENGAVLEEKPEHMTHLTGDLLVLKTHRRIVFRGQMDTLEAELILCQLSVDQETAAALGEVLALVRLLLRCEVLEEPVPEQKLCGLTEAELRRHSHFPQEYYGQPHFMPEAADGLVIAQLNRCRCTARMAERAAVATFTDEAGNLTRSDLVRAMNRLSSMIYVLMIRCKAKKEHRVPPSR